MYILIKQIVEKWMAFDLYGDRNRYDVLAWMSKPDPYVPEEN